MRKELLKTLISYITDVVRPLHGFKITFKQVLLVEVSRIYPRHGVLQFASGHFTFTWAWVELSQGYYAKLMV